MTHQLSSIRIINYKSIVDCEFILSSYTPLIGYNNAGKSNIINAIKWLRQKSTLAIQDFYDSDKPVEVIGIVTGITEEVLGLLEDKASKALKKYIKNEKLTIRRLQTSPYVKAADVKLFVEKPDYQGEDDRWHANPGGIDNAIIAILPEPIHVGAMENAEEDVSKNKAGTTIGELLKLIIGPIEKTHGETIRKELNVLSKLFDANSDNRAKELTELDDAMNNKIDVFFQGVKVKVHVPTPELKEVFSKGTIKVFEAGVDGGKDVSALGHGAQRSVQMALIQYLSEIGKVEEKNIARTLLLIDEPELYLHPQAIIVIRDALKKLSKRNYQIIFSTHSPILIEEKDMGSTVLVRKSNTRGTYRADTLHEAVLKVISDKKSQSKTLFSLTNSSQILFSETIVLAEGKTEQRLLPIIFEAIKLQSIGSMKLALIDQGGSGNTKNSMEILNAMGLPTKAIVDLDYVFKTAISNKTIKEDDEDYVECKKLMASIASDKGIELGEDGWPKKKGKINAEQAFAIFAAQPDAIKHIDALHDKLKSQNIWIWKKGAIEEHLGGVKKDEDGWFEFTDKLISGRPEDVISDYDSIYDCINWLMK